MWKNIWHLCLGDKKVFILSYDYMDSFSKFDNKQLPEKNEFYSMLSNEHLTDELNQHATNTVKFRK